eukprot:CAMPEP_0115838942 /NCGR_PEP_ID=MMETSP0287-20121206/5997_1 /TAXON_ID=412157 /ORGANISM="Chrysochromulina rotalis, Strain UIO044" /LENGTH=61 /DNA_ID=CAMNT_0003292501 /DNA_START=316 /DNA_END=501 /DNA_ORIENTATION=+
MAVTYVSVERIVTTHSGSRPRAEAEQLMKPTFAAPRSSVTNAKACNTANPARWRRLWVGLT